MGTERGKMESLSESNTLIENYIMLRLLMHPFLVVVNPIKELYDSSESELKQKSEDINFEVFRISFEQLKVIDIIRIDPIENVEGTKFYNYTITVTEHRKIIKILGASNALTPEFVAMYSYNLFEANHDISKNENNDLLNLFQKYDTIHDTKVMELQKQLDEKIAEHDKQIKLFYSNIVTIMSILVAAFSVIGFNIEGIGSVLSFQNQLDIYDFIGSIVVINLTIILSIYFLLLLVNRIVNNKYVQNKKTFLLNKSTIFVFITFLLLVLVFCFIGKNFINIQFVQSA